MALFDKMANNYDSFFDTHLGRAVFNAEAGTIMNMLDPSPRQHALDAGCGTGVFTSELVSAEMDVTGIDESVEMLKIAESKDELKTVRFVRGDITKLPFEPNSFDRVLCGFVIEFIEEARKVITELKRVLKPGGILVVATLNSKGVWAELRRDDPFWAGAIFRSVEDMKEIGLEDARFAHCVYFPPNARLMLGMRESMISKFQQRSDGAVVVARWQK